MPQDIISKLENNKTYNNDIYEEEGHPVIELYIKIVFFFFFANYL